MKAVFADTFYWVALIHPADPRYREAVAREDELSGVMRPRDRAARTISALLHESHTRVIPQSRQGCLLGLDLYGARADNGYSMADCISMQAMRREELNDVLNDWRFEQEGFRTPFRA